MNHKIFLILFLPVKTTVKENIKRKRQKQNQLHQVSQTLMLIKMQRRKAVKFKSIKRFPRFVIKEIQLR